MSIDRVLRGRSLVILLPDLHGGGIERLQLDLLPFFSEAGLEVTLLLGMARGALLGQLPVNVRVVSLDASRQLRTLLPLVRYLRRTKPAILLAHTEHSAMIAVCARAVGLSRTRIIVCQHNAFSAQSRRATWQFRVLPKIFRYFIRRVDRIVAVSKGVGKDLIASCGIASDRLVVIHNGVIDKDFSLRRDSAIEHRWFDGNSPVLVAVGRLVAQKDFATLLVAFAKIQRQPELRLVLLGEGPLRQSLLELARQLGVEDRVDLPGFRENPLPYMREAALLVVSSRHEGFGMVIAEALACGTPVVSTDCPHGPAEILDDGRYGRLVPVNDPCALAKAITDTLDNPPRRDLLKGRGGDFTVKSCADQYLALFATVLE